MIKFKKPEGYDVNTAKSFVGSSSRDDNKPSPEHLELTMTTPYTYNGEALSGYADVSMNVDPKKRYAATEVWCNGRNMEDITGISRGEMTSDKIIVHDTVADKDVTLEEAHKNIKGFALEASQFEHVMAYDEYCEVFNNSHKKVNEQFKKLGMEPQVGNEDNYYKYLERCKHFMTEMDYIGEITTPDRVDNMNFTIPSVQKEIADWDKEFHSNDPLPQPEDFDRPLPDVGDSSLPEPKDENLSFN